MTKDTLTKARRSWNMSRIRGKDTTPEKVVRSLLHRMGYRFRLHVRIPIPASAAPKPALRNPRSKVPPPLHSPPGTRLSFVRPDIILPKYRTAIFVHGCFWHRHKGCKLTTRQARKENRIEHASFFKGTLKPKKFRVAPETEQSVEMIALVANIRNAHFIS